MNFTKEHRRRPWETIERVAHRVTLANFKAKYGGETKIVDKKKVQAPRLEVDLETYRMLEEFYNVPSWIIVEKPNEEPTDAFDE